MDQREPVAPHQLSAVMCQVKEPTDQHTHRQPAAPDASVVTTDASDKATNMKLSCLMPAIQVMKLSFTKDLLERKPKDQVDQAAAVLALGVLSTLLAPAKNAPSL